jgi:hypothetical protein
MTTIFFIRNYYSLLSFFILSQSKGGLMQYLFRSVNCQAGEKKMQRCGALGQRAALYKYHGEGD